MKALKLSVRDNGVGLDTTELASSSGHGIQNMRRMAHELGRNLEISSAPGKGTMVTVALPLSGGAP